MNSFKSVILKILHPPVWLIVVLSILSTASLIAVFVNKMDDHPISYAVYVASFYTLTVACIAFASVFPKWYKNIKQKAYENRYSNRYLTDVSFKTHISLYQSLAVNLMYVATNIVSYLLYHSAWFVTFAVYYIILAVMRFLLLRYSRKNELGKSLIAELKRSRLCAIILLTVNLSLSSVVLMILYQNKGFEYYGILIYVMAMYTFYATTHAIIDIVKYRKYNSPVISTAKVINLSAALFSMLSLETAMLTQFGTNESPEFRRIMVALTGAGISIIVVTLSIIIIIRAGREIKKLKTK